jgi:hypothetical protein
MIQAGTGPFKTYKLNEEIKIDCTYTSNTYSGVYISSVKRVVDDEHIFIDNAIEICNKITYNEPYQLIKKYQEEYPTVLKTRLCIASLTTMNMKILGIIWFDDGNIDIYKSLENIINDIDWTIARDFEY